MTATVVVNPAPDCTNEAPTLDGQITVAEWGDEPSFTFVPEDDASRKVAGYLRWVGDQLYLAFEIADPTINHTTDSIRIYFDANMNAGDPDSDDRFFQIVRDNTLTARSGIGTNEDGLDWNSEYQSDDWNAVVSDAGAAGWSTEIQIKATNEMPDLSTGDPFGLMLLVQYTGSLGLWPEGAISNNAGTWQDIDNFACQ